MTGLTTALRDTVSGKISGASLFCGLAILLGAVSCTTIPRHGVRTVSRSYSAYMKGLLTERAGELEDAIAHYQRVQELDQESPSPHTRLGLNYIGLKDFKRAAAEFRAVVRLAPEDNEARYALALIYAQLGEHKKAAEQYEILLEKYAASLTQEIQLRRILSQLYFLEDDFLSAKKHGEKILQWSALDQGALYLLGLIASEEGRDMAAIGFFKKILAYYPDDVVAMNGLAFLYAENGTELGEALDLATQAVQADPYNASYLDTLGWVYFRLGETGKAIELLERALKLEIDPVILDHLAQCYAEIGDDARARGHWETSLALDPSQEHIRLKLKELQKRK